jgi:hypothetical protein
MTTFGWRVVLLGCVLFLALIVIPALVQDAPVAVRMLGFAASVVGLLGSAIYCCVALWKP